MKNTHECFGDAYDFLGKLLYYIRDDFDLLIEILIKAGNYMGSLDGECEVLVETVINFFFEDFNNSEQATIDFYEFLKKMITV